MSTTLTIFFSFLMVYFILLSDTGLLERKNLARKHKELIHEVDRLENENQSLIVRKELLQNDEKAIKHEARKYYLLSTDSGVIKFKEPIRSKAKEKVLIASQVPEMTPWKLYGDEEEVPPLGMVKAFYIMTATLLGIGVYLKIKNYTPENPNKVVRNHPYHRSLS